MLRSARAAVPAAALTLLLGAAPAKARTSVALVSNTGASDVAPTDFSEDAPGFFTTGSSAGGTSGSAAA